MTSVARHSAPAETGAEVLDGSRAQLEHARALIDLGATLRREGKRRDCREPLAQGMEIAHRNRGIAQACS